MTFATKRCQIKNSNKNLAINLKMLIFDNCVLLIVCFFLFCGDTDAWRRRRRRRRTPVPSHPPPQVAPVLRCPLLTLPNNGRIKGTCSRLKDSRCDFECDQGFNLTHNAPLCIVMNSDASWDGPVPSCIGLQCEEDEVLLPNGQTLIFNQTEVGKHAYAPIICATSNADHCHNVSRLCYYNESAGASWRDPLYQQCLANNPTMPPVKSTMELSKKREEDLWKDICPSLDEEKVDPLSMI
nr:uncharacterized protein LOC129274071 [Lytechinus pictus]